MKYLQSAVLTRYVGFQIIFSLLYYSAKLLTFLKSKNLSMWRVMISVSLVCGSPKYCNALATDVLKTYMEQGITQQTNNSQITYYLTTKSTCIHAYAICLTCSNFSFRTRFSGLPYLKALYTILHMLPMKELIIFPRKHT